MATLEELQTAVSDVLQDDVFSSDRIIAILNQGVRYCAAYVLLPELESSGSVTTIVDVNTVDIPEAWLFDRNIYHCVSTDDTQIRVLDSFIALIREYPDCLTDTYRAEVERVLVKANSLIYYPIPAEATELTCNFYRTPPPLVNDSDIPSCIPLGMQEELLVNYVLWKCFSELEDGFEGPRNNTQYYRDVFNIALAGLDTLIDYGQSRTRPVLDSGWI